MPRKAKTNNAHVALSPPTSSNAFHPGMCVFVAASDNRPHESSGTRPQQVDELVWHDGTEELDDFCGPFGALDVRGSRRLSSEPPDTALVVNGRSGEHGLKHVCNLGLETWCLDGAATWSLPTVAECFST